MEPKHRMSVLIVLALSIIISGCLSGPLSGSAVTQTPTSAPEISISTADGMELLYVPAGEFTMGSNDFDIDEKPMRTMYLDAFWIDKTEVTQSMYAKCTAPDCKKPDCAYVGDNYPVVCVRWKDANAYCKWAGRRLPTEFEWEKAARGTDNRVYPWGDEPATCKYAVMDDLTGTGNGCGKNFAWEVGSKPLGVSPYGAQDMAGNVAEWVSTWDPYAVNGAGYVLRGGGFLSIPSTVRVSKREVLHLPIDNYKGLGFRCASSRLP